LLVGSCIKKISPGIAGTLFGSGYAGLGIQQIVQIEITPQNGPQNGEKPRKAVRPRGEMGKVTQNQMHQQANPHLPTHGTGAMAEKVSQLQGLFDFLEKCFNVPSTGFQSFLMHRTNPQALQCHVH